MTDVWDADNNVFDWSELKLGDMVDVRLDVQVTTTSPNQHVEVDLMLAIGGFSFNIPFSDIVYKSIGLQPDINIYNGIHLGNANILDNPARFEIRSDAAATVVVKGWYCKVLIRGG